jgi:hypothetical protein
MHRLRSGIVGMALLGLLAGCGGSTVDEGPKPFTPTDTTGLNDAMVKDMQEKMKSKDYTKVQQPPPEKSKEPEKKK